MASKNTMRPSASDPIEASNSASGAGNRETEASPDGYAIRSDHRSTDVSASTRNNPLRLESPGHRAELSQQWSGGSKSAGEVASAFYRS
jgi:hypothetical protein